MRNYLQQTIKLCYLLLSFCITSNAFAVVNTPSIESEGIHLSIVEALIDKGQVVSLLVPQDAEVESYTWIKSNQVIGHGPTLKINSFSSENSGIYKVIQKFSNNKIEETQFKLNQLNLGENIESCGAHKVKFLLPEGPDYTWSTGTKSNNFTTTFQESTTISVTAVTEFGLTITDEQVISIIPMCASINVNSINDEDNIAKLNISSSALDSCFPLKVFASKNGQEFLLTEIIQNGTQSIIVELGDYTNVFVASANNTKFNLKDLNLLSIFPHA